MAVFLYQLAEGKMDSPYIGPYHAYGLRILREDEEIMTLPDVSTDRAFALHLADLFTREQLDPVHLMEVLEDLL